MTTTAEVIIEMMPFSEGLKEYCKNHPEFFAALKVIYPEKFIALGAIMITRSPNHPEDEVIGVYVYDYMKKTKRFKQDFIVNIGNEGKDFVLYTGRGTLVDGKKIKHIKEFLKDYGKGGFYEGTHWQAFEELPDELKERARKAIALGEKRKAAGNPPIPQGHVDKIYRKLTAHREENE